MEKISLLVVIGKRRGDRRHFKENGLRIEEGGGGRRKDGKEGEGEATSREKKQRKEKSLKEGTNRKEGRKDNFGGDGCEKELERRSEFLQREGVGRPVFEAEVHRERVQVTRKARSSVCHRPGVSLSGIWGSYACNFFGFFR
jgi:hypothetical protein